MRKRLADALLRMAQRIDPQPTFLPTNGSELANKGWLQRIADGLAGKRPDVPNIGSKQ